MRNRTPKPVRNGPDEAARLYAQNRLLVPWCYRRFFGTPSGSLLVHRVGGHEAAMQLCRVAVWEACRRFDPAIASISTYVKRYVWGQLTTDTASGAGTGAVRVPVGGGCVPETQRQRARARACLTLDPQTYDPPARDDTPQRETREELDSVLDRLRPQEARLLRMYYIDGRTLAQIGAVLGRTRERARQLIVRAMRHARATARQMEG